LKLGTWPATILQKMQVGSLVMVISLLDARKREGSYRAAAAPGRRCWGGPWRAGEVIECKKMPQLLI